MMDVAHRVKPPVTVYLSRSIVIRHIVAKPNRGQTKLGPKPLNERYDVRA